MEGKEKIREKEKIGKLKKLSKEQQFFDGDSKFLSLFLFFFFFFFEQYKNKKDAR